ncbi:hypothetical protein [Clostridium sp.]|uniref:hypothetical protein n=1 Tax=Clostridium sp. TaxID=1506 RepID=UPI003995B4B1|nr:hypothetical protein [Clostridium celatum]
MINYQEYIATKLKKMLEKMINLSTLCLNNLIAMIIGIYHTTIDDRFVILQFSLKVSKRDIQLWFKLFKYKFVGQKG